MTGVNPYTPTNAIAKETLERMLETARGLLRANVRDGSSEQIQTFRNLRRTGHSMDPSQNLWVYGRARKPCRKCGSPIEARKMGLEARSTYWCGECQPVLAESRA